MRRAGPPLLPLLLLIAGCSDPEPLPPSGVQGPIILHQWKDDGRPPLVVVAHQLIQGDMGFRSLDLEAVLVRMPFAQGTLFIAAPRATYSSDGERMEVRLRGDQRARLKVSGEIGGEPMIGTAEEAWYEDADGALNLSRVELCIGGAWQTVPRVRAVRDRIIEFIADDTGSWSQREPPPGLHAVMAALPRPLRYPDFKRGDFAE